MLPPALTRSITDRSHQVTALTGRLSLKWFSCYAHQNLQGSWFRKISICTLPRFPRLLEQSNYVLKLNASATTFGQESFWAENQYS